MVRHRVLVVLGLWAISLVGVISWGPATSVPATLPAPVPSSMPAPRPSLPRPPIGLAAAESYHWQTVAAEIKLPADNIALLEKQKLSKFVMN